MKSTDGANKCKLIEQSLCTQALRTGEQAADRRGGAAGGQGREQGEALTSTYRCLGGSTAQSTAIDKACL